jgi:hypothetical protein
MGKQHSGRFVQFVDDDSVGEASQPQPIAGDTSVAGHDEEQGRGKRQRQWGGMKIKEEEPQSRQCSIGRATSGGGGGGGSVAQVRD